MVKVIFLDIDGVLNNELFRNSEEPYPLSEFDPKCIERLNKIIEATNARIVLSSSWKYYPYINTILTKVGINIWDKTPNTSLILKGREIQVFLKQHPEITNYVIIDDENVIFKEQESHFIKTKYYYGLTDEDVNKAINILNNA